MLSGVHRVTTRITLGYFCTTVSVTVRMWFWIRIGIGIAIGIGIGIGIGIIGGSGTAEGLP